jgi:leucyl-tRNA synthetase
MQRNWIGKSVGAEVDFPVADFDADDAPSSPSSPPGRTRCTARPTWSSPPSIRWSRRSPRAAQNDAVAAYRKAVAASDRDRLADAKDKTGVFTGAYAVNPSTMKRFPIWIATTSSWATAPARSWPSPPTMSAITNSPQVQPAHPRGGRPA